MYTCESYFGMYTKITQRRSCFSINSIIKPGIKKIKSRINEINSNFFFKYVNQDINKLNGNKTSQKIISS